MRSRYGATHDQLGAVIAELGEPRFRHDQLVDGLWRQRRPLSQISTLPARTRTALADALPLALDARSTLRSEADGTVKWLWAARRDGAALETVLMRYQTRSTVCVSSQAGCAMACTFCATGQDGFARHLAPDEIVEQVLRAQHETSQRVSNVVYMGMGEPLANLDAVWASIERLHADLGIGARQITLSTIGVVPGMRRLRDAPLPVTLAVSIHAPDDDLRATLVPLARTHPLAEVLDAAFEYASRTGRRVTFEYACIAAVNDDVAHADALGRRLRALPWPGGAHVNVIPLNPTDGFPGAASPPERIIRFAAHLRRCGVTVTVRRNRGRDIDAACGQLRSGGELRGPGRSRATRSGTMAG